MSDQAEGLAQRFHEIYERLAPQFGYGTRRESAKPWVEVPEQNRRLMVAVCAEILGTMLMPDAAPPDGPWYVFGAGPWISVVHAHGRSFVLHGMAEAVAARDALNRLAVSERQEDAE